MSLLKEDRQVFSLGRVSENVYEGDVVLSLKKIGRRAPQSKVQEQQLIRLAFQSSLSLFCGGYTKKPTVPNNAAKRPESILTHAANLTNISEPKAAPITINEAFIRVLPNILRLAEVYIAIDKIVTHVK